jgi:DmsE family decaheme c-type cytochrome
MKRTDRVTRGLLLLFLAWSFTPVTVIGVLAADQPSLIGSKACAECHEETVAAFAGSLHAKAWAAGTAGCESCHGPGGAHQKDQTRATIVSFTKGTKLDADQLSSQCLACHAASSAVALWDSGPHRKNGVSCSSCHSIHGGPSPVARQPDVCYGCHRDVKSQVGKLSHHPIPEGKLTCSSCHNTHGTLTQHLVNAETINELCYGCHAEKRGPFVWEHSPVEENCDNCHTPHGSRQTKLLVQKLPNLCQECHDWSRHPGTAYDAKTGFSGKSPSNRFFARSCMNCHAQIHGSWSPANPNNGENAGNLRLR